MFRAKSGSLSVVVVRASCALGVLLQLARPCIAHAQEAPAADAQAPNADDAEKKKEEAKVRFQRGLELVQNENWDAALAEFLVSRELYPTRVALKNAGICLRQLKRYTEALAMYRELEQRFGSSLTPDEKKNADDAITQLTGNVGEISVDSAQPGSTIVVDGKQAGTTPLAQPLAVNAGTHTVRVVKEGYQAYEEQVLVAGGQRKAVRASLEALRDSGTLIVREASGKPLDVVVDGAVVGQTPTWQGLVAIGKHTVFLRGKDNVGTPPSSANTVKNQSSTLTLSATELDSEVRIEPTPSNAVVNVDSVEVGSGVWEGRLKSGSHVIEVAAEGFNPYRKDVSLKKGANDAVKVSLERDLSNPMWSSGFSPHFYFELFAGGAYAPGFGGGADKACTGSCKKDPALGVFGGGRVGYAIKKGLGVEFGAGFLAMKEKLSKRTVSAEADKNTLTATDYADTGVLAGPFAGLSVSYRLLDKTPLTIRLGGGAVYATTKFTNQGTYVGDVPCAGSSTMPCTVSVNQAVAIPEETKHNFIPYLAPEVRFGYKISNKLSVDIGAAFFLLFPPDQQRTGTDATFDKPGSGDRKAALTPIQNPAGTTCSNGAATCSTNPGLLSLPHESKFGTLFAVMPTLAGRFDLL